MADNKHPFTIMNGDENAHQPGQAAQCIQLSLLGKPFRPEFTHQCFPGEVIRGYQPISTGDSDDALVKGDPQRCLPSNDSPARQYDNDQRKQPAETKHEIDIQVSLAPSCRMCRVTIETRKAKRKRPSLRRTPTRSSASSRPHLENHDHGARKRQRLIFYRTKPVDSSEDNIGVTTRTTATENDDDNNDTSNDNDESDLANDKDDEEYVETDSDQSETGQEEEEDDAEGATRRRRMPVKEVRDRLSRALPAIVDDTDATTCQDDFLRKPLGSVLKEYQIESKDGTLDCFCLTLADGQQQEIAEYHRQVQKLAILFIETADEVDITSQSDGFWKVIYLFQKHTSRKYSLAGFVTLFHFRAPFRKPVSGIILRICQALILPPYQRCGHGRQLLHTVHNLSQGLYQTQLNQSPHGYAANDEPIVEINVEDPAKSFTALRNRVDYECFLDATKQNMSWFVSNNDASNGESLSSGKTVLDPNFFAPLPDSQAIEPATRAKITVRQIQIVSELSKLHALNEYLQSTRTADRDELEKKYRLMVKKRLQKLHKEELGGCRNKQEMQAILSGYYDEVLAHYQDILKSIHRSS